MLRFEHINIRGFKSIERLEDFALGQLNVLIGDNGAGKSNFVEFFRLLGAIRQGRLRAYMERNAPADGYFYKGIKQTRRLEAALDFGMGNGYSFWLEPTADGGVLIGDATDYRGPGGQSPEVGHAYPVNDRESQSASFWMAPGVPDWQVYHFHDTSATAGMRREAGVDQAEALAPNGDNLAAFLLALRAHHGESYQLLRQTVQRVMPHFDDFDLRKRDGKNEELVRLTWRQKGSDYIFQPGHLSDGTLRFICLATALLQPNPPATAVFDEPELGLHPEALVILAGLFRSASARMQIIVATQSPVLLNEFEVADVITVDNVQGATQFNRLDKEALRQWLEDYTLGDLWQKGTLRGGVNHA